MGLFLRLFFSCIYMAHGHNAGLTWISLPATHLAHSLAFYKVFVIMKGIGLQYIYDWDYSSRTCAAGAKAQQANADPFAVPQFCI